MLLVLHIINIFSDFLKIIKQHLTIFVSQLLDTQQPKAVKLRRVNNNLSKIETKLNENFNIKSKKWWWNQLMVTISGRYYHIKAKCQVVKEITIQVITMERESYFIITRPFFFPSRGVLICCPCYQMSLLIKKLNMSFSLSLSKIIFVGEINTKETNYYFNRKWR